MSPTVLSGRGDLPKGNITRLAHLVKWVTRGREGSKISKNGWPSFMDRPLVIVLAVLFCRSPPPLFCRIRLVSSLVISSGIGYYCTSFCNFWTLLWLVHVVMNHFLWLVLKSNIFLSFLTCVIHFSIIYHLYGVVVTFSSEVNFFFQ